MSLSANNEFMYRSGGTGEENSQGRHKKAILHSSHGLSVESVPSPELYTDPSAGRPDEVPIKDAPLLSCSGQILTFDKSGLPERETRKLWVHCETKNMDLAAAVSHPSCRASSRAPVGPCQISRNATVSRFLGDACGPLGTRRRRNCLRHQPASPSKCALFCDLGAWSTAAVCRCISSVLSLCSCCATGAQREKHGTALNEEMTFQECEQTYESPQLCAALLTKDNPTRPSRMNDGQCETRQNMICDSCTLRQHGHHVDHAQNDIHTAREEELKRTSVLLTRLRSKMARIEDSATGTLKTSETLARNVNEVTREVNMFYDGYVQALEARRRDLLEDIDRFRTENMRTLRSRKSSLDAELKRAKHVHDFGKTLLHFGSEMPEVVLPLVGVLNKGAEPIVVNDLPDGEGSPTLSSLKFCKQAKAVKGDYKVYGSLQSDNERRQISAVLSFAELDSASRDGVLMEGTLEFRDSCRRPLDVQPQEVQVLIASSKSSRKSLVPVSPSERPRCLRFRLRSCWDDGQIAIFVTAGGRAVLGSPFFFERKAVNASSFGQTPSGHAVPEELCPLPNALPATQRRCQHLIGNIPPSGEQLRSFSRIEDRLSLRRSFSHGSRGRLQGASEATPRLSQLYQFNA